MNTRNEAELILEVRDLQTHFFTERGVVQAVKGVSFQLENGQTLGIVGESAVFGGELAGESLNGAAGQGADDTDCRSDIHSSLFSRRRPIQ